MSKSLKSRRKVDRKIKLLEERVRFLEEVSSAQSKVISTMRSDLTVMNSHIAHLEEDTEHKQPELDDTHNMSPVYVTAEQAKTMSVGDCWIMAYRDDGWLLVGNGEVSADEDGNGVWMDPAGNNHYGP